MADGLLDNLDVLMNRLQPSEEERRRQLREAALTFGIAALGARKGALPQDLSRAGLLSVADYNQGLRDSGTDKLKRLAIAQQLAQWQAQQQQVQEQRAMLGAYQGMPTGQPSPMAGMPSLAPTVANAATLEQRQQAAPPANDQFSRMMAQADYLENWGKEKQNLAAIQQAAQMREHALKFRDENLGFETVDSPTGPKLVQRRKYGAPQELPYGPKPETQILNLGNRQEAVDKLRIKPGQTWEQGLSPDTQYTGNITMRGQNMTDARARDLNAITQGNAAQTKTAELRKEFNALPQVKAYGEVQPVLQSARESMGIDSAAADLNLIYAAAKIFDPTSVVRESETTMVMNSGSPAQRFLGQFNYVAGGGRLTPEARKALMAQVESRGRGYESGYKAARTAYEGVAKKQGIPAEDVFVEPFAGSSKPAETKPAATVDALPATAPVGTRARDTKTGRILTFDGKQWR